MAATTMPLWITAEIVLREAIQKHWNPNFHRNGLNVVFAVLENEYGFLLTAPEEHRSRLNFLFAKAKGKMFSEVGFPPEQFFYMPSTEQTLQNMTDQLLNKIRVYEEENGYDVKEMFLQAVLHDEWKMPAVKNIDIEFEFGEEETMNKEILTLENLLTKNGIPFYFNYREENRPTPFGAVQVDMKNEELFITVGPAVNSEAVCVFPVGAGDDDLLKVVLPGGGERYDAVTADAAFVLIKGEFLKHRAEWWPEVYGNEK